MIKITTNKQIPTIKLTDLADITQINKSLEKIDELFNDNDTIVNQANQKIQELENKTKQLETSSTQTNESISNLQKEFNTHKEATVTQEEGVHGIRFREQKIEVKTSSGWEVASSGGGLNIPPKDVTNIKVIPFDQTLLIKWVDPENIVYDTAVLSDWVGTKVVYKTGDYPQNPNDGTLVIDNKIKDKYKTKGYKLTGLTNDTPYYISFFPYNSNGVYNINPTNRITSTPNNLPKTPPNPVTGVFARGKNKHILLKWTDPTDKEGAKWETTRIVYKSGSMPENCNDGQLLIENTEKDKYKTEPLIVDQLQNNTQYYFKFCSLSEEGGINDSVTITATPSNTLPNPVTGVNVSNGDRQITIKWTDPTDITDATWAKTRLVYSENNYVTDENQGTLVLDNTVRDKYKTNGYTIRNLKNGVTYYFTFFTYSTASIINNSSRVTGKPIAVTPNAVTGVSINAQDRQITIKWTDATNKTNATWLKTRIIYSENKLPENSNDGRVLIENTIRDKYKTNGYTFTGLTNNKTYYFRFCTISSEGGINDSVTATGVPIPYKTFTVKIDQTNSNPSTCCTYSDDATSLTPASEQWNEIFGFFPCLFKNGEIVGRLNKNDRTKFEDGRTADISSGNEGDVMIAFPRRKLKITNSNNIVSISLTDNINKLEGFYDLAHKKGNDPKDYLFIGAYKGCLLNGKLRSLKNTLPVNARTLYQARELAKANGRGYELLTFYPLVYLQCLYLLKYKNLNSQNTIGFGCTNGSNNEARWQTGGTEKKPMDWGSKTTNNEHVILFGIEDIWGNLQTWIDGLYIDNNRSIKTSTNNIINSNSVSNFEDIGTLSSNKYGYLSKVQGTTYKGFIAKETNGSSSTYYEDLSKLYNNKVGTYGGASADAQSAGLFYLDINHELNATTYVNEIGARLMYL